jgi:hypothetical protein
VQVKKLAALRPHRAAFREEICAIHVDVRRTNTELKLYFRLTGNISRIFLLPAGGRQRDELWRRTCFEAFVAIDNQAAYHEFNWAPSRQWRVYALHSYRVLDPAPLLNELLAPIIDVRVSDDRLELDAMIILSRLSELHPRSPLRVGLAAIVEQCDGSFSYWALHHPAEKPDFHHPDAFALRLEAPRQR